MIPGGAGLFWACCWILSRIPFSLFYFHLCAYRCENGDNCDDTSLSLSFVVGNWSFWGTTPEPIRKCQPKHTLRSEALIEIYISGEFATVPKKTPFCSATILRRHSRVFPQIQAPKDRLLTGATPSRGELVKTNLLIVADGSNFDPDKLLSSDSELLIRLFFNYLLRIKFCYEKKRMRTC